MKIDAVEPQNVANSKRTFRSFLGEIFVDSKANLKRTELSVAFVSVPNGNDPMVSIGSKIVGIDDKKKNKKTDTFVYGCRRICGIVLSWSVKAIYYIPFSNTQGILFVILNITF